MISTSELIELQNEICEENARLKQEVVRINSMFAKIKFQNKQNLRDKNEL